MAAPSINSCPRCHAPRRPHRICPNCGTYAGREIVAPREHDHDHDHEHDN
jgi:large subunit ribosomal protein L32